MDKTLEKAMRLFWRNGYTGTSVRDLVENTGVAHAGLYSVFGDKDGLFIASLNKYANEILGENFRPLEQSDAGRDEIEVLFSKATGALGSGILRDGCFIANSAVEFAGSSGAVVEIVRRCFRRQVKAFEHALKNAVADGDARADLKVKQVANTMVTTFYGMSVLVRFGAPLSAIYDTAAAVVAQMD
ncbi:MAG: TetR/AcrR family transcriptional regulator [Iphinoe sp. HA4291-MV1]|jgi:TetR/AcrR family transcriptional repressor of nem operon|nr:TetR/AcrR family transcriptional regulator [Iphinoe sp. HA4291-MV1]